jgi:virulence-associated protein VapD
MSYAISFDLDTEQLKQIYPTPSWQNAYGDIKKILTPTYPWFKPCIRDIRMLRIEELNDLTPAL